MRYIKRSIIIFLTILFPSIHSQSQIVSDMDDESRLYAETKQVNQFFRRFNGEEDERGERYYARDNEYRNPRLRKKYLNILFDASNTAVKEDLKREFIEHVTNKTKPVILDFHGNNWFSEVSTTFTYKGKEHTFILYMTLEKENLGYKWVISKVYSDVFHNYIKKDTTKRGKFLHPLSHELDFMNLRKALNDGSNISLFTEKSYKPDYLTLFLFEIKSGNLKFKTIRKVKFHFFQVDGWYFELSDFNRPGYNRGWLISDLIKVADKDKDLLKKYIYYEDK